MNRNDIQNFIDEEVNPALEDHGGFITIEDFDESTNNLKIKMGGGCQGCSMSRMTLRSGIENHMRENFPDIGLIEDVTDHESGESPYFAGEKDEMDE